MGGNWGNSWSRHDRVVGALHGPPVEEAAPVVSADAPAEPEAEAPAAADVAPAENNGKKGKRGSVRGNRGDLLSHSYMMVRSDRRIERTPIEAS